MMLSEMKTLKRTLEIDAPPQEVWRVLTDSELVREWAVAYGEGMSIRTNWREGGAVAWRDADGAMRAGVRIAAFEPMRLLRFEYSRSALGDGQAYVDTYSISPTLRGARLEFTSGPFEDNIADEIERQAAAAIVEIKGLAEESAEIHGMRSPKAAGAANG
jgi:uncharacterized protein YndB with AHSA1/START domain